MSTTIKLNGVNLPGAHPNISSFISALPAKGLQEYWLASEGVTTSGSDVTEWLGFTGTEAKPGVSPEFIASLPETGLPGVAYNGSEVLNTSYHLETGDCYVVMALRVDAKSNDPATLGQRTGGSDKFLLGTENQSAGVFRPSYGVGDMTIVKGVQDFSVGDVCVIGVHVSGSNASIRANNVSLRTESFGGTFGAEGGTFNLGGDASLPDKMFNDTLAALAIYTGSLTTGELSEIDKAMGAYVGLSL